LLYVSIRISGSYAFLYTILYIVVFKLMLTEYILDEGIYNYVDVLLDINFLNY